MDVISSLLYLAADVRGFLLAPRARVEVGFLEGAFDLGGMIQVVCKYVSSRELKEGNSIRR
jgi:hypothetical protein